MFCKVKSAVEFEAFKSNDLSRIAKTTQSLMKGLSVKVSRLILKWNSAMLSGDEM